MIVDTMTKYEVYKALIEDFEIEILPFIIKRTQKWVSLISARSKREKRNITLPIQELTSSKHIQFYISITGDATSCTQKTIAQFIWNGKQCYAMFLSFKGVTVFTKHCLDRYSERVLKKDISPMDVLFKHLYKGVDMCYFTILPSRTHKFTIYYNISDGLFLGNGLDRQHNKDIVDGKWFNTCISLDQAGLSQMMMMTCMKQLYDSSKYLGYAPIDNMRKCADELIIGVTNERFEHIKRAIFIEYLLQKVQQSFDVPFTSEDNYKITEDFVLTFCSEMDVPKKELQKFIDDRFEIIRREISYIEPLDNNK